MVSTVTLFYVTIFSVLLLCIACTPGRNRKRNIVELNKNEELRRRLINTRIAGSTQIEKAAPYEEIHLKMHGDNFDCYKSWPELDKKSQSELVQYCNKYLRCFQFKDRVIESKLDSQITLELKNVRYHIEDSRIKSRHPFHKTRAVLTLMCRVSPTRIRRFVEAADGYSAFYVLTTNTKGNLFTIVDACPTEVLNKITLEPDKIILRQRFHADSKMIEKAIPYQEIHLKLHESDLELYKEWPELEGKDLTDLQILCYKYIKCIGKKIGKYVTRLQPVMDMKMIKYYVWKEIYQSGTENILYQIRYENRLVRVLGCHLGFKVYQFVNAGYEYSVFYIMPTSPSYNLFTIVDACPNDILNATNELIPSDNIVANQDLHNGNPANM